jgi:hypothetical protein
MLMMKQKRPAIRTLRGWVISVLQDAGAIRECEEHGWMQDRGDPDVRERAFDIAHRDLPDAASPQAAQRLPRYSKASATPVPNARRTWPVSIGANSRDAFAHLRAPDTLR